MEPLGRCHGSEEFRQELLAQVNERARAKHTGEEIRESAPAKAKRIAAEELASLHWGEEDLARRRKSDGQKIRMAVRLRSETTMTPEWIAEGLRMGAPTPVAALLQRRAREAKTCEKTLF